jgi:hypothetical protein
MSLDERLRSTLSVVAEGTTSPDDIDTALERVVRHSTRAKRRRHAATLIAAGVVVIAGVAAVANSRDGDRQHVNIGPVSTTTVAAPRPVAAQTAFCPDHYRFTSLPAGWSIAPDGTTSGLGGSAKLAAVVSSSATTVVRTLQFVGFGATERTDGHGVFEVRLDDEPVNIANTAGETSTQQGARTDPSCGGELAVVASGVTEDELALIVNGVIPRYSLVERQTFHAIWPSSDLDLLMNAGRSALSRPEQAANAFAGDQLGWHEVNIVDLQPTEDGTGSATIVINGGTGTPTVTVIAAPVPGTGYWAVNYASSFATTDDFAVGVSVTLDTAQPDTIHASFAGAASAELTVRYGNDGIDLSTTVLPALWTFELGSRPDIPGGLLIRWRDATGQVVAVFGTALPPGDFAAS